ncbi:hypothetical protein VX159_13400 [Dechloromonas sp. ZY10]|uniref:hypothetical protein n=1 Tax=Dechloromonas aquae TaxID=2664436 RepID=UPI0035282FA8
MTNQNPENAVEPQVQEEPQQAAPVAAFQPNDARRRLRELLSVPERERTDEQWDEIIELEIQLAPGNRIAPNESLGGLPSAGGGGRGNKPQRSKPGGGGGQQKNHQGQGQNQNQNRPRGGGNNRRPRQNKTPAGGGGSAA